jgi:Leucine-rich repeat (LRR) protein
MYALTIRSWSILKACATLLLAASFMGCKSNAVAANQRAAPKGTPTLQTSAWGPAQRGLQCRATVPKEIEQGLPLEAVIEFKRDPETEVPGISNLNLVLPTAFLSLFVVNAQNGQQLVVQPFDPTSGMGWADDGSRAVPFSRSEFPPIPASFPLVKLYKVLTPGAYECEIAYSFPTNPIRWFRDEDAWKKAAFWAGTITSGRFLLNVRPEIPKTKNLFVPKRLTLCKEFQAVLAEPDSPLVSVPIYRFRQDDADEIQVPVRNGHFVGTRCSTDGSTTTLSGAAPEPGDANSYLAWYDYHGGGKSVEFKIEVFETADPPQHMWSPGPFSGGYRVLWTKTFKLSFSDQQFQKMPATAFDFSRSKISDAGLSILRQHPSLQRLSLGNKDISNAGLVHLDHLRQLESLHLYNTRITDAGLAHLKQFPILKDLTLSETKITDRGLVYLRGITHLESLDLSKTRITDAGLKHLEPLGNLKSLFLYETEIGNRGLKHLRRLTKIETLFLSGSNVSDPGLKDLAALVNLKSLRLDKTKVSDNGVKELQKALPGCSIER